MYRIYTIARKAFARLCGKEINFRLLSLGVLFISGLIIGSYLLMKDNYSYSVTLVFDMVDRVVWGGSEPPLASELKSSYVQNIYVMQANTIEYHNYVDCVAILQKMQMMANLPYNFLDCGFSFL